MRHLLYITIILSNALLSFHVKAEKENPFSEMAGKTFGEYHDVYHQLVDEILHNNSHNSAELIRQFSETAKADSTGEWDFNYRMFLLHKELLDNRDGLIVNKEYDMEHLLKRLLLIADEAEEKNSLVRIRAIIDAATIYRVFLEDYESYFQLYLKVADDIAALSVEEFPPRFRIYKEIGDSYFMFKEYDEAKIYYQMITEDPKSLNDYYYSRFSALNGLGLCYRYGTEDYAQSDACFMSLAEATKSRPDSSFTVWQGIIGGNMGYNQYLQGNYDAAIPLLRLAVEKITRQNDYPFISWAAIPLADIYLKKGDLAQAKKYATIAQEYHYKSKLPEKDSKMYAVLSKYNTALGNIPLAFAYLDSTLTASSRENENFSGLILMRIEQQHRTTDRQLYEKELIAEKLQVQHYRQIIYMVLITATAIMIWLITLYYFYKKKQIAYQNIVRQSQRWANINMPAEEQPNDTNEPQKDNPDEDEILFTNSNEQASYDIIIMESVKNAISAGKLYKQHNLTLDTLASITELNRYYISGAMNRCEGKHFNAFINEYRVKEAIHLISDKKNTSATIEEIAYGSGFNDRTSFYRSFKKITGLSPAEFRKALNTKL